MSIRFARISMSLAVLLFTSAQVWAWSSQSQVAVVTTAGRLVAKEGQLPLGKFDKEVRAGASVSSDALDKLVPGASADALGAIEREMQLLRAVRGTRVDSYYAYRLGVLGKLVAQVTAPMADSKPLYRKMYQDDVDAHIGKASLTSAQRQTVASRDYFARARQMADINKDLIERDYQSGVGFAGVASQRLGEDVSRSVNAVADVWFTVAAGQVVVANVSAAQRRDYIQQAMAFYTARGNAGEIDAAYDRYKELGLYDADLMKNIGDMFYDAKLYGRAVKEYQAVLASDPHRKDVVRRIADYYIELGDGELEEGRLEVARDNYAKALDADALHPDAEQKRLMAERLITERDARLAQMTESNSRAKQLQEDAEENVVRGDHAQAITELKEALGLFRSVTDEFPTEKLKAQAGITNVEVRLREIQDQLIMSADQLSGSGMGDEVRGLASKVAEKQRQDAFREAMKQEYEGEVARLRDQLERMP